MQTFFVRANTGILFYFTCSVVLSASMGMMNILHPPAAAEAAPVFKATGRS